MPPNRAEKNDTIALYNNEEAVTHSGCGPFFLSFTSAFFLRYKVADNIARTASTAPLQSVLVSIKQLYGVTCLLGCLFLLLVLLYDVQPLRSTMKKIPHWAALGRRMARDLRISPPAGD